MKRILLITIPIVAVFCVFSVSNIGFFEFLELKMLDVQFTARGKRGPDPRIIIAGIDEKSLAELGQWPWPRDKMAALVRNLREAGAKVIAFDIIFAEADRAGKDGIFAYELGKTPGAILGYFFDKGKVPNISILADAATEGYFSTLPDRDGVVRRMPLVLEHNGRLANSLSLEVISKFSGFTPMLKKDAAGNHTHVIVGDAAIPIDTQDRTMINYLGPGGTFPYASISDIIAGDFDAARFKDSIVLVGAVALGLSDVRPTPFSGACPGPEIHASIIDNILGGRYLQRAAASEIINFVSLILIGILSALVFSKARIIHSIVFQFMLMGVMFVFGFVMFAKGTWIPVVYQESESVVLFVGIMLLRYFTEGREKKRIRDAFQFYLAPAVIDNILKDGAGLKLGGERREITILFSDVRNFTTMSEGIDPERLVSLMNEYFTKMTDIILEEGGLVDKYIGDAIMAFFGAPAEQKDQAERACRTALRMQACVKGSESDWIQKYSITGFKIGVGINSGIAYVGNMGSSRRFNYTAVGDSVNVASRLEGLTKQYSTPIVVSSSVRDYCGDKFIYNSLGSVQVKGKTKEIEIFGLASKKTGNLEQF